MQLTQSWGKKWKVGKSSYLPLFCKDRVKFTVVLPLCWFKKQVDPFTMKQNLEQFQRCGQNSGTAAGCVAF